MPRYLVLFKYSEASAKGLMKEKAAAREAAGKKAYESVGGRAKRSIGYPTGNITARRLLNCQTPLRRRQFQRLPIPREHFSEYRTIELLTTSEFDAALERPVAYRPLGG